MAAEGVLSQVNDSNSLGTNYGHCLIGTRFIATQESNAPAAYKQMIVECSATDVVYTDVVSGIHGNYLRPSLAVAGIDPDNPRRLDVPVGYADHGRRPKAWRDIWSAGHGVGGIEGIESVGQCMERLQHEYDDARARLANGGLA